MARLGQINRKTNETDIQLSLNLDGKGVSTLQTGIGFFDHMLTLFSKHGRFDLTLAVKGDLEVDFHHTVEDVGICLGQVFREALGDARGITRYASLRLPMDEALCDIAIDVSNRPVLIFNADLPKTKIGEFDTELMKEFFQAFVSHSRVTLHVDLVRGDNLHHCCEACFKALGVVLRDAVAIDPKRADEIPSTKGLL